MSCICRFINFADLKKKKLSNIHRNLKETITKLHALPKFNEDADFAIFPLFVLEPFQEKNYKQHDTSPPNTLSHISKK